MDLRPSNLDPINQGYPLIDGRRFLDVIFEVKRIPRKIN